MSKVWRDECERRCGMVGLTETGGYRTLSRYRTCEGMNVAPDELVDLLYAIAGVGLPFAWNGYEILLPSGRDDKD